MLSVPLSLVVVAALAGAGDVRGGEYEGPGRFCGYSPIIDLLPGERVKLGDGGIHAGSFRWQGRFGDLDVVGVGWAQKPKGRALAQRTRRGQIIFAEKKVDSEYVVAIWNGRSGAAYFTSPQPMTAEQRKAIDRVGLYQEGQRPKGCKWHTTFSWDF